MVEYRQLHTDEWLTHFAHRGHKTPRALGAGVEGAVYRLDQGLVAKVWTGRPPADLDLTRQVYADIARHPLPFATPEILDTETHNGVLITYERELTGSPFRTEPVTPSSERDLPATETAALLTILRALATVPGTEAMRRLTIQGDNQPLWHGHTRFPDALAALVRRATHRHHDLLAAHVPNLSATVQQVVDSLTALPDTPVTAIHGDLVPPNIHTDDTGHPTAVLDFGFYTTAGDPAFEAAVTAAIWDMYGPHAEHHTATLTSLFASELGHPADTLALYQAVYALTTYDLFSSDGSDGHFHWCAALLRRHLRS